MRELAHYDQLITEELAGIISPADQAELDAAKAESPEVYKLWEEKHAFFAEKDIQEWAAQKMAPPKLSRSRIPLRYKRALLVAAVMTAFLLFLSIWNPVPQTIHLSSTRLELRFDNGKVFDLSELGNIVNGKGSLDLREHAAVFADFTQQQATLWVPEGKEYKIILTDGSEAFLNSASCLRFPISFNDIKYRHVEVSGEAYFKIASDAGRPFSVMMQKRIIQVLGTEFNVKNYDKAHTQVLLVTGKVRLQEGKRSVVLPPGVVGTFTKKGIDTASVNTEEMLSWRRGIYIYNEQPPEEVLKVVARWIGKKVVFEGHLSRENLLSGDFDRNNPAEFFNSMKDEGFECSVEEEVIRVKGK